MAEQPKDLLLRDAEKLSAMLGSIGDHMSMMDKDLNIIWANDVACSLFGKDLVGKKCYEAYHQRTKPCDPHPCLSLRALADGHVHKHDTKVIDKDNNTIYFHCTANVALRDESGQPSAVIEISRDVTAQKIAEAERDALIEDLRQALANIKTLQGLLPICSSCKKIRDDDGCWHQVEEFVHAHSDANFSHSICPDCIPKVYPDLQEK